MKTIQTTVYEYDELNDKAKENARLWASEFSLHDEWYESTFEDAERIGLKITAFDLDRRLHAKGEFIDGPLAVAVAIMKDHGETCATYKTAQAFKEAYSPMIARLDELEANEPDLNTDEYYENEKAQSAHREAMADLEEEFLRDLLSDYATILQNESEWLQSDEYLEDMIKANEYTFTETGKRFG